MTAGWGSFSDLIADNRADAMAHSAVLTRGGGGPEAQVVTIEEQLEDREARLTAAGYRPGTLLETASRAQELSLQITEERGRIERAEAASRYWHSMFEQGRIGVWELQEHLPADSGDPAKLERLQAQLAAVRRTAGEAGGAVASATRMAAQMTAGTGWEAERAQRMGQAENEALVQRAAENGEWFRGYMTRYHERGLARAQGRGPAASCPECAAMGATAAESAAICHHAARQVPSGTGWPAGDLTRATGEILSVY